MNFIGIDPGKGGGIAVINGLEIRGLLPLAKATERDVWDFVREYRSEPAIATIEKVSSSPQMGVTSSFTFGRSLGYLRGMLTAMEIRFDEVSPQRWQKLLGCLTGGDKNISKAKAQQLFPQVNMTHAIADALLIAEYGQRTSLGEPSHA